VNATRYAADITVEVGSLAFAHHISSGELSVSPDLSSARRVLLASET
jgi:hypothetical protein